jgi:hypothetical protein
MPVAVTAVCGIGTFFCVQVLRHFPALHEVMNSVVQKEAAENSASEKIGELHGSSFAKFVRKAMIPGEGRVLPIKCAVE